MTKITLKLKRTLIKMFSVTLNIKRDFDNKSWIRLNEFNNYLSLVLWSFSVEEYRKYFKKLLDRISKLIKLSGWTFSFKYLKEVLRITVRLLAKQEVEKSTSIFVKTDSKGCPVIIPKFIRDFILFEVNPFKRRMMIRALLTILSINRVFSTEVDPSIDTVIAPFNGLSKSIDSSLLIKSLKELKLYNSYRKNDKCTLYWSEASGPNTIISGFGSINDALALLHTPKQLILVYKTLIFRKNIGFLLYISSILVLFGPLYYLTIVFNLNCKFVSGRLSVVYDQAGKARVIAITSYWFQTCLKPLHLFLFKKLKLIDEDGTFDQDKPFNSLLSRLSREKPVLHGFDLSAATDRLPIDLQQDILKLIGFNLPWKSLLDIKWYPNFSINNDIVDPVSYSVGQPMGALSSWAMLAISHHVIVKCAAIKSGIIDFKDYCILGDDVVIANDIVASEYLNLMTILGLSINLQKSVESNSFTEFAKKLKGYNGIDFSPLGPGLILQTIRSKAYSLRFTHELFLNKLIHLADFYKKFTTVPKFFRKRVRVSLWSIMLNEYISFCDKGTTFNVTFVTNESASLVRYMSSNISRFYWPLLKEVGHDFELKLNEYRLESKRFFTSILLLNLNRKGYHGLPSIFNVFNLGFYHLLISYFKTGITLFETYCKIYVLYHKDRKRIMNIEFPIIWKLLDQSPISSINWGKSKVVKDTSKFMTKVCKSVDDGSLVKHYLQKDRQSLK
jgi:hypothetical protein